MLASVVLIGMAWALYYFGIRKRNQEVKNNVTYITDKRIQHNKNTENKRHCNRNCHTCDYLAHVDKELEE